MAERMTDPQANTAHDEWRTHDGRIAYLDELPQMHLINAYRTCKRLDNPKSADVLKEIEARGIAWMLAVYPREAT